MTEEQIKQTAIGVAIRHSFCNAIGQEKEIYDVIMNDYDDHEEDGMFDNVNWVIEQYLPQNEDYDEPVVVWDVYGHMDLEDLQWHIEFLVDDICASMKGE